MNDSLHRHTPDGGHSDGFSLCGTCGLKITQQWVAIEAPRRRTLGEVDDLRELVYDLSLYLESALSHCHNLDETPWGVGAADVLKLARRVGRIPPSSTSSGATT